MKGMCLYVGIDCLMVEINDAINATRIVKTGNRAEQLIKGVTKIVISLSFQFSIVRVAMIAGIAHASPDIKGTMLLPFNPNLRMILSIMKTTRAM